MFYKKCIFCMLIQLCCDSTQDWDIRGWAKGARGGEEAGKDESRDVFCFSQSCSAKFLFHSGRCTLWFFDFRSRCWNMKVVWLGVVLSSYTRLSNYSGIYPIPHASDFPKDHPMYSLTNKKVLGKMKDKRNGMPITECVRLRPKMY